MAEQADLQQALRQCSLWRLKHAIVLQGKAAVKMFCTFDSQQKEGNFSMLPELHATLSGLKVSPDLSSRQLHGKSCCMWRP